MKYKNFIAFIIFIFACSINLNAKVIGYSSKDLSSEDELELCLKMKKTIESNGDVFYYANSLNNARVQKNNVFDMVNFNIDVLIINPVNEDSLEKSIEVCHRNGIKVINFFSVLKNSSNADYCIKFDMDNIGEKIIESIKEEKKSNESVNIFAFINSQSNQMFLNSLKIQVEKNIKLDLKILEISKINEIYEYLPYILTKTPENSILLFPNVSTASFYSFLLRKNLGNDKFSKYCYYGSPIDLERMKDLNIKAVALIDNDVFLQSLTDTLNNLDELCYSLSKDIELPMIFFN